jgi:polyisoprenoid-binding protein YceI
MKLTLLCACTLVSLTAQDKSIDLQHSTLTIHVGKAGLFSAAGHEHWINAPISSGKFNESDPPRIEFTVNATKMEVKPDPKVDAKTQAEIQKDMQDMTLESAKYPEIVFRSSRIVKSGDAQWKADGALTLHGVTKTVHADVKKTGDAYTGRTTIKQTDFGIKPVTVGGGLVKVKDELDIEFQIR